MRFSLWLRTQNFDFFSRILGKRFGIGQISTIDPAAEFPQRFLVPYLKFPQRFLVPAVKKLSTFTHPTVTADIWLHYFQNFFYSLIWKHHPVLVLRCWLNRRSSSRSLIGQQLQQQLARRCQAASLSRNGRGMRRCCTPRQSRIWRVRTFRTRCRLARFGPAWSSNCLDAVERTMLSSVKMEGHEHPEWSGGGYYGETEVSAPNVGWPPSAVFTWSDIWSISCVFFKRINHKYTSKLWSVFF